jgi:hypothetical protein
MEDWHNFGIEFTEGFFLYSPTDNFNIKLGRYSLAWGSDSENQTLLNRKKFSFDGYKIDYRWRFIYFETFFAKLDTLGVRGKTKNLNRYLNGHRISFLGEKWQISFSEIILYGGENRGFDFAYANPFTEYFLMQGNEKESFGFDDNPFIMFDFAYFPFKNAKFYGELMIDDFQIDNETVYDREPTEMGLILGVDYLLDKYNLLFNMEYLRINPWTYNQPCSWNRFVFRNQPIGYEAIDLDVLKMSSTLFWQENYDCKLQNFLLVLIADKGIL